MSKHLSGLKIPLPSFPKRDLQTATEADDEHHEVEMEWEAGTCLWLSVHRQIRKLASNNNADHIIRGVGGGVESGLGNTLS